MYASIAMKVGVIVDKTFMTKLRINHVRHLKDITIPLSNSQPKHLVLTGKNGSGKTSVLKSVVDFLTYVVSRNFYSQAACLESVTFNQKRLQELDNSEQDKQNREGIERDIAFWTRFLDHWIDGTVAEYLSYADLREKYLKGEYILAYYGDDREIKVQISKNIEKVDLQDVYSLQDHPSKQLVKYLVNLKTTEAFAKTNGNEARAAEIHAWFDRFQNVLRSIYSDDTLELKFDIETFAFTICQAGHDPFDFNSMSMGYNLFLSCPHCNSVKNQKKYEEHIIDCCKEDPEASIRQELVDSHVVVTAIESTEDAIRTAGLLTECFEKENTGIRILECQTRVNALQTTMTTLYRCLANYKQNPSQRNYRTLRGMLNRNHKFAGFTRTYVRNHIDEYPNLSELVAIA